ncbi:CoA transferase subunit A [Streptomyces sp. SAJ15]|uniref:CoA transferase subunit A n=1 Tax=Streptomyces sp. SAJ15 TaxID=2011095 RepID=UPI0021B2D3E3|nr:CoA-transferase [Streptomyces sp. SAJ15]
MTADEAVGRLSSGMTVGIGGWGARRKPMALVRALLRSDVTDLTVVSYGGPDVGLLAAAGRIRRLVTAFATLDSIPLEPHFRAARQRGGFELTELDEAMVMWGLTAAVHRVPFMPVRAGLGSDVMTVNPGLRTVRSPYEDGEELAAVPALRLDAALVHLNRADARGNGQYLGPDPYFDDLFCEAATEAYVSCERVVASADLLGAERSDGDRAGGGTARANGDSRGADDDSARAGGVPGGTGDGRPGLGGGAGGTAPRGAVVPQTLLLRRDVVTGVIEAPHGAHFTSCAPDYGRDEAFQRAYAAAAADPAAWREFTARFLSGTEDDYQAAVAAFTEEDA